MAEVAELAGVSKITVSRALSGSDLVRPELKEKIVKVAHEAGYRMNVAARNLRTQRTRTIAVVFEELSSDTRQISEPVLLFLLGGLMEVLTPADYAMLVTTGDHFLNSHGTAADGVIMIGQGAGGRRMEEVAAIDLPMVVWGAGNAGSATLVGSDNEQGGRLAAQHLLDIGRRRLLFLGDTEHAEVADRLAGIHDILSSSEAMLVAKQTCDFSRKAGAEAIRKAIAKGLEFDGILAASDYIAAGACDALIEAGLAIPDDVAVVGFDDISIAANNRPALSSIRQDWGLAGQSLASALIAKVEGRETLPDITLPVELVIRESTAGPQS